MRTVFLFMGAMSLFLRPLEAGEPAPERLPEVLVTADGGAITVPSPEASRERLRRMPGGASFVDAAETRSGRASTPQDLLGFAPGVFVQQRDTAAQESRLSVRGSGLQRTFHLRGVNVLQDGVPLNQADGSGDLQRVDPLAVRYAEVRRGGNALRHGAATLGGAIDLVTHTGRDAAGALVRAEGGSFDYRRAQAAAGGARGAWDGHVSASAFSQTGYREHVEQDNLNLFANAGWRPTDAVETRLYAGYVDAQAELGGSLTRAQMATDPRQANPASVSGDRRRDLEYARLASRTVFRDGEREFSVAAWTFTIDLFHPIHQVIESDALDAGGELRYEDASELAGRPNALTLGFLPTWGRIDEDRWTNLGGRPGARTAEHEQTAWNAVVYAEDRFEVIERWAVTLGGQLLHASRESEDAFFSNGDDSGETLTRAFNPKAGASFEIAEDAFLFAGYNRATEPPTFAELFDANNDFRPNKAQIADTVEAGLKASRPRWDGEAVFYHARVDNELLSLNDASGNPLGTVNAPSDTVHRGVELGGGAVLCVDTVAAGDALRARLSYAWNDFRLDGDPAFGDNRLPGLPRHYGRAELRYEHPSGFYVAPNVEWTWQRYPVDFANSFFADPYAAWGVKTGVRSERGFSWFVEGKNVTDETYAASTGIVADARGADSNALFNPGSGVSWYAGVERRW